MCRQQAKTEGHPLLEVLREALDCVVTSVKNSVIMTRSDRKEESKAANMHVPTIEERLA